MSDQDVFDNKPIQATPDTTSNSDNPFADQLKEIKNEDGQQKYGNVEEALKGSANAQQFIQQLKEEKSTLDTENERLRAELEKASTLDDVVNRITANQKPQDDQTVQTGGLDEQAVLNLFQKTLESTKAQETHSRNEEQVLTALANKYGEKTKEVVANRAKELGTTPASLGELARENPTLVLTLFGETAAKSAPSTTSSINFPPNVLPMETELKSPEKSLLSGATSKEQTDFMKQIKEKVYKKYDVQT